MKGPVLDLLEKQLTPSTKAYVDAYAEQLVLNGKLKKEIEDLRQDNLAMTDYIGSLQTELENLGFKGFPDYPSFKEQRT